jgi:hypothetical protein
MRCGLGGRVEADPGPVGQVGDPFRSQHRREGAEHACQAPARHDWHPADHTLPQGTWAPCTATIGTTTTTSGSGST